MPLIAQKKTERSNHFEALFEYASMGILITNGSGEISAINPFALKEFGYTEKELMGKKIEKLIPARFRDKHVYYRETYIQHPQRRALGEGKCLFALRKDGTEFPVEISLGNYHNNGDKYVIAFISNISGRKKAEDEIGKLQHELESLVEQRTRDLKYALHQLEVSKETLEEVFAFQKAILDNAGAMIIVTDANGIIKLFNPEACRNLGYDESEVINKHSPLLFHDPSEIKVKRKELFDRFGIDLPDDFAVIMEYTRRNPQKEQRFRHIRKDGSSFPVSLNITTLFDKQGEPAGYMGVVFDISEQVRAENELISIRDLFLQLIRNFPDGTISIINKDHQYVFTGGETYKHLEIDPQELIGKNIFPLLQEDQREPLLAMVDEVFEKERIIVDYELPFKYKGQTYMIDIFPLIERNGSVNYVGSIARNISDLKKAEDDLLSSLKKERELGELKTRFLTMASHEFRTPLSTVLSSAYLIEKYSAAEDQPKRERHLRTIVSSVYNLTELLNDFLSVGKIEERKIDVNPAKVDIRELVTLQLSEFENNLKKGQQIKYVHKGVSGVMTDPKLMKHIIMNLVSNAIKFSKENTAIEINTETRADKLLLSVKDHGIGIPEEDQKHLAERFFRGSNAGDIEGTGLGLYIISKYAELLNGRMNFKSKLEEGTEFTITFNLNKEENEKDIADRRQ